MELGQFIAKVISEIKENVKGSDNIGGESGEIELDLIVYTSDGKVEVMGFTSSENASRIKIPLQIGS